MEFEELIKSKKVIICCGSGGVGKTTISASIAVKAAQMGKKVLVLTIDPARRLATSLGLTKLTDTDLRVGEGLFKGEMYAAVLDAKKVFDEFLIRLSPSQELADRVLKNKIYLQFSSAMSASQEYSALERLLQTVQQGTYDLVVLDTPPTKHAIDFLRSPGKVHALFQDSILKWFMMPFVTFEKISLGIVNRGTKAAFKAFEKLAGAEFLGSVTDFFVAIKDWQGAVKNRATEVHELLLSDDTAFLLITGFNSVRIEEARYFSRTLEQGGYHLNAVIVNRTFPFWEVDKPSVVTEKAPDSDPRIDKLRSYFDQNCELYRRQYSSFLQFSGELRGKVKFYALPDFESDIHDLKALQNVASRLGEAMHYE